MKKKIAKLCRLVVGYGIPSRIPEGCDDHCWYVVHIKFTSHLNLFMGFISSHNRPKKESFTEHLQY